MDKFVIILAIRPVELQRPKPKVYINFHKMQLAIMIMYLPGNRPG